MPEWLPQGTLNLIVQFVLAGLQFVIVGLLVWYSWETHGMRVSSEQQVALLRDEARTRIAPLLLPTLEPPGLDFVERAAREDLQRRLAEPDREPAITRRLVAVRNLSSSLAQRVSVVLFDHTRGTYGWATSPIGVLLAEKQTSAEIAGPGLALQELVEEIEVLYGEAAVGLIVTQLSPTSQSFIVALCQDQMAHLHLSRRPFTATDGDKEVKYETLWVSHGDYAAGR